MIVICELFEYLLRLLRREWRVVDVPNLNHGLDPQGADHWHFDFSDNEVVHLGVHEHSSQFSDLLHLGVDGREQPQYLKYMTLLQILFSPQLNVNRQLLLRHQHVLVPWLDRLRRPLILLRIIELGRLSTRVVAAMPLPLLQDDLYFPFGS